MTHSIVTPGTIAVTITSSQPIGAGSATLAVVNASIADDAAMRPRQSSQLKTLL